MVILNGEVEVLGVFSEGGGCAWEMVDHRSLICVDAVHLLWTLTCAHRGLGVFWRVGSRWLLNHLYDVRNPYRRL